MATNIAISYYGNRVHPTSSRGIQLLAMLVSHIASRRGVTHVRLWYDKIYCLDTDWDTRVSTGWLAHALLYYSVYPGVSLVRFEKTKTFWKLWPTTELASAKLDVGYAAEKDGSPHWVPGCRGWDHWNTAQGARQAQQILNAIHDIDRGRMDEAEFLKLKELFNGRSKYNS